MHQVANLQTEHYQQTLNTMLNMHLLTSFSENYKSIPKVTLPDPPARVINAW